MDKPVAYVVYFEPEYEGGGSYTGVREFCFVFYDEDKAREYCKRSRSLDYEVVEIYE